MSYHLVTREEITGITIYTRVEQIKKCEYHTDTPTKHW